MQNQWRIWESARDQIPLYECIVGRYSAALQQLPHKLRGGTVTSNNWGEETLWPEPVVDLKFRNQEDYRTSRGSCRE